MLDREELLEFLKLVDKEFVTPLSAKVDLETYADKLLEKASIHMVRENGKIVALFAGYNKNIENNIAYMAILACLKEVRGKGYGARLICEFLELCRKDGIKGAHLYTDPSNKIAMHMYDKLGFTKYEIENEPRPEDAHLIYWFY